MTTEEMLREVDRRVADDIVEHLLPKAIKRHTRSKNHNCNCTYCQTRDSANFHISNIKRPEDMSSFLRPTTNTEIDFSEAKEHYRDQIRNHFRKKLDRLIYEL